MTSTINETKELSLPEFLYRIFDAEGQLLYIGVTCNLRARIQQHAIKSWSPAGVRVTVEVYPDRDAAFVAERKAILAEQPRMNVALRPTPQPPHQPRPVRVYTEADLLSAQRLEELGNRYKRERDAIAALLPELAEAIRREHADGMPQVEIVRKTGYTRDMIRKICLPPERRTSRARSPEDPDAHPIP